ncbi:MAG: amphi-Trp domain-containing protein [Pseudomonadota bacterium]
MATNRDVTKSYSGAQHIEKLERLVACMKEGKVFEIQVDNERIRVPERAVFSIEHERGEGMEELEFQFRWTTED